jgi:hypothetical protein
MQPSSAFEVRAARASRAGVHRVEVGSFARSTAACSSSRRELMPAPGVIEPADAAVVAQPAHLRRQPRRPWSRAGIAERAEVLARVEAERRRIARLPSGRRPMP